jgi:hypothetical protein
MTTEISPEVKRALIENEITLWRNTAYQAQLRHRVNKKLGADEQALKALEDELLKAEKAVDILTEMLAEIK